MYNLSFFRPLLISFKNVNDKKEVLKRKKFLPKNVYMSDFVTSLQRKMQEKADKATKEGLNAVWKGRKLFIDNKEVLAENLLIERYSL